MSNRFASHLFLNPVFLFVLMKAEEVISLDALSTGGRPGEASNWKVLIMSLFIQV